MVIGSTSDQISVNVSSVHFLMNPNRYIPTDGRLLQYKLRGKNIIHCWDPPHLIKVLRNNLQKKNLRHGVTERWNLSTSTNTNKTRFTASWKHIENLYQLGRLPTLTNEHLNPVKEKMKVSTAAQVFSQTVGDVMLLFAKEKTASANYSHTAQILLFFNDLFDSFNGGGQPKQDSLKGSINESSIHFAYWEYALSELRSMDFINITDGRVNEASTVLRKFESTIRGYIELTRICLNASMKEVALRYHFLLFFLC